MYPSTWKKAQFEIFRIAKPRANISNLLMVKTWSFASRVLYYYFLKQIFNPAFFTDSTLENEHFNGKSVNSAPLFKRNFIKALTISLEKKVGRKKVIELLPYISICRIVRLAITFYGRGLLQQGPRNTMAARNWVKFKNVVKVKRIA